VPFMGGWRWASTPRSVTAAEADCLGTASSRFVASTPLNLACDHSAISDGSSLTSCETLGSLKLGRIVLDSHWVSRHQPW
jgi:hypothetical protein